MPRVGSLGGYGVSPVAPGGPIPEVSEVLSAWREGLVARLQAGRALGFSDLGVWVWGQQFQSPMFLGTQPPYATKALMMSFQWFCTSICILVRGLSLLTLA